MTDGEPPALDPAEIQAILIADVRTSGARTPEAVQEVVQRCLNDLIPGPFVVYVMRDEDDPRVMKVLLRASKLRAVLVLGL